MEEQDAINKLIKRIEEVLEESDSEIEININDHEWSPSKLDYMKKYGHLE